MRSEEMFVNKRVTTCSNQYSKLLIIVLLIQAIKLMVPVIKVKILKISKTKSQIKGFNYSQFPILEVFRCKNVGTTL